MKCLRGFGVEEIGKLLISGAAVRFHTKDFKSPHHQERDKENDKEKG